MSTSIRLEVEADGTAIVTIDMPDRSMNVVSDALNREFAATVDRIATDATIARAIITSGKTSFLAGADLREMLTVATLAPSRDPAAVLEGSSAFSRALRRLETCGKPVVAAITGTALGGGFEICLACHGRIAADNPAAQLGLPEVKVGLLPGAGGTQRVPRMIGIKAALPLLLEGRSLSPRQALEAGLVDAVVPPTDLLRAARDWLAGAARSVQPWDRDDFQMPGPVGQKSDESAALFMVATATLQKKSWRNYPAPQAILRCVYEGTQVPIDTGLAIESRQFALLLRDPVAASTVRTLFVSKQAADKLEARPAGIAPMTVRRLGVLGAGMMGQGIAFSAAAAGIDVVLLDRTREDAERGKAYSRKLVEGGAPGALRTAADGERLLARITPTVDYADLAGCDLVIEAVFEARDIKAEVTRRVDAVLPRTSVFASNTSTLPISGLAETFSDPTRFIGLHFFSPVDKMALVEVILGRKTSDETLAHALDFVKQIRKTPIVVRDSRGFYTSRCFGMFPREGMTLLLEGVHPALVENAARMAGMPVGPLAVADEVSIELIYKVREQEKADVGAAYRPDPADPVIDRFVVELARLGRKSGGGFYDYPAGGRKALWDGLQRLYPAAAQQPGLREVQTRILYRQAVEAARCLDEGVITKPADGDLGAILGWGFAAHTGGPFSMIDTTGPARFVEECDRLARACGERFAVPASLRSMAAAGRFYYPRPA
jgi:3-hydroxyacyl-CoA dehydrogenase/enoyl-CoA hydratase/3-hydroxybutyryl-CoA epimerase